MLLAAPPISRPVPAPSSSDRHPASVPPARLPAPDPHPAEPGRPPRWLLCTAMTAFWAGAVPALAYEAFARLEGFRWYGPLVPRIALGAVVGVVLLMPLGWHLGTVAFRWTERRMTRASTFAAAYVALVGVLAGACVAAARVGDDEPFNQATLSDFTFTRVRGAPEFEWCAAGCLRVWLFPEPRMPGRAELGALTLNLEERERPEGEFVVHHGGEHIGDPLPGHAKAYFDDPANTSTEVEFVTEGGSVTVERVSGRFAHGRYDVRFRGRAPGSEEVFFGRLEGRFTAALRVW